MHEINIPNSIQSVYTTEVQKTVSNKNMRKQNMFPPGLEPGTFRVLGERDNHYTTETWCGEIYQIIYSRFWLLVQKSSAFDAFQSPKELFRPDKRHRNLRKMF